MASGLLQEVALAVVGLAVLLVAGDLLVRGACSLAAKLRIPTLIVGLTIVAFGTSAPELFVSVQAVLDGEAGIAIGNIVGSNIANVLLVIGGPALIYPVDSREPGVRRYASAMLAATALFASFAYLGGVIDTRASLILLGGLAIYLAYAAYRARSGAPDPVATDVEDFQDGGGWPRTIAFIVIGLVGLPVGAGLLVENGAAIALELGVRQEIVGLTLVAFGTSLPELAATLAGAVRREYGIVIGNILGSNLFNLLAVGGAIGLAGGAEFDRYSLALDIPVMAGAALLIAGVVYARAKVGRLLGAAFLLGYAGYLAALATVAT